MNIFWKDDRRKATLKKLRDMMEFGDVVRVTDDEDNPVTDVHYSERIYPPEIIDGKLTDSNWTLLAGYSGQMGTKRSDPGMHPSEYIGGRLAENILREPGLYVALAGDGEWYVATRDECWHVGNNTPGFTPTEPATCFDSWTDALRSFGDEMLDFADGDDEQYSGECCDAETDSRSTHALATATLLGSERTVFKPGIVEYSLPLNDGTLHVFFIHPTSGCDHEGCDHEESGERE